MSITRFLVFFVWIVSLLLSAPLNGIAQQGDAVAADEALSDSLEPTVMSVDDVDDETVEEELDDPEESDMDSEEFEEEKEPFEFSYYGFVEVETYLNTDTDQDLSDTFKKTELRNRLVTRYGLESAYLYAVTNLYLQPTFNRDDEYKPYRYSREAEVSANLTIGDPDYEISWNELYCNFGHSSYRLRVGNQIFSWGTADGINPTAYFNPYDMREFIFRDDDEQRLGVPAVSGMLFGDDYTLELVLAPVHVPMRLAPNGNYWSLETESALYSVHFEDPDTLDFSPENFGYGARISFSIDGNDFSFSGYRGPDRETVLVPAYTTLVPNAPAIVNVKQQYDVVHMVGVDFVRTVDDFVFQVEAAYSPDKRNIVEQNVAISQVALPFSVKRTHYLSYAAGFNYFIPLHNLLENHEGESVFTFEWFQARFFGNDVAQSYLFTDLLTFRYEDTFFGGRIPVELTAIFDARHGGEVLWPKIGYDFLNGWSTELSYAAISGRTEGNELFKNSFYYYRDNDTLMMTVRYEY